MIGGLALAAFIMGIGQPKYAPRAPYYRPAPPPATKLTPEQIYVSPMLPPPTRPEWMGERPPTSPAGPPGPSKEYSTAVEYSHEVKKKQMTYEQAVSKAYSGTRQEWLPI